MVGAILRPGAEPPANLIRKTPQQLCFSGAMSTTEPDITFFDDIEAYCGALSLRTG